LGPTELQRHAILIRSCALHLSLRRRTTRRVFVEFRNISAD
jgi:hypothetical protein